MPHPRPTKLPALVIPLLLAVAGRPLPASASDRPYFEGEIQVKLADGVSIEHINAQYGTTVADSIPPCYLLRLPGSGDEVGWTERLLLDPDIAAAECSWTGETPEGVRQMVVVVVGGTIEDYLDQNMVARLHLPEVNARYTGRGILVAVLDTGVTASHEALADRIAPGGWDFVSGDGDPSDESFGLDEDGDGLIDEGAGHGTMVAGLVHLAAPDAQILPVRVLDDEGRGSVFNVAKGIRHAAQQGAQVINLSLGLQQHTFVIQDQILWANENGIAIIAAAGNLAEEQPAYYPAIDPQTLSVAALDSSDVKASFSNWHRSVDISAPGVGILAPYRDGGYAIGAGTSFSVPFISAQCSWILEENGTLPLVELYRVVREGVVDIYEIPENDPYLEELGSGRLDGQVALHAIQGISSLNPRDLGSSRTLLRVFPNPLRIGDQATIWMQGGTDLANARNRTLRIHDAGGRLLDAYSLLVEGSQLGVRLRLDRLARGTYFLSVDGMRGESFRLTLVR